MGSDAQVSLPQNSQQRVLLEPRGTRRLASQTLLDVRVSRTITFNRLGRIELLVDVLNALNDTAERDTRRTIYSVRTSDSRRPSSTTRRVMIGVRVNLGGEGGKQAMDGGLRRL